MRRFLSVRISLLAFVAVILAPCKVAQAQLSVTKTVFGTTGPWNWVNGGLNTAFQYGIQNNTAPVVFSALDGFAFTPGSSLTITYLSGLASADGGAINVDANGDPGSVSNNGTGITGRVAPSFYFSSADYPANLLVLSGVFADNAGSIVGIPFKIGLGRTVTIPVGATRLQLGTNDDQFIDNTGSFQVRVSGAAAAPEPGSVALLVTGIAPFAVLIVRRRKRVA